MRVIITGGSGLIGSALSRQLVREGHEVIVLTRDPERHRKGQVQGVRLVEWDARTARGWGSLADGAGAIINLAGENLSSWPWSESRKQRFRDSRVNAGNAVVEAVSQARQKPGVVIQASGINYYGVQDQGIATEEDPPGDDFLSKLCIEWEASTAPVEAEGVRRVVTRSGLVLSTQGGALPLMALPFRLFVGGPVGGGKQWISWIHLEDEVRAIRFLLDRQEASGVFNLTAPVAVTNAQFSRALGRAMSRPALIPVPAFALRLALGEMAIIVLEGKRVEPRRLQALGFDFRFEQADEALKDLYRK